MKNYARDYEGPNTRTRPDAADVRALGLSSRHGATRSKKKRATRRYWNGVARRAGIKIELAANV